ncbi:MAG: hypothetical protein QM528_08430 [Phycisphaerales bacterium]|nr:hypothetical protein [Phycisphaerales bacterium]
MIFYNSALVLGLAYSFMAVGVFISLKLFNIFDLTTDASFTLGAVLTAVFLEQHVSIVYIMPIILLTGALTGAVTGLIHILLKLDVILSGILVLLAMYSINVAILHGSNLSIDTMRVTLFNIKNYSENPIINTEGIMLIILILFIGLIYYLLKTDFGIALRAVGNNKLTMTTSLGINHNRFKVISFAITNVCTALSGSLIAQYQHFADINMGNGVIIIGLGAVMIANSLASMKHTVNLCVQLFLVVLGSILFQLTLATALLIGIKPYYLKLLIALIILTIVLLPKIIHKRR